MAGTAILKKAEVAMKGGTLEIWKFSLDPASIAAAAQGIETVAIPGARAGDPVFVNAEAIETQLLVQGAKVTGDNEVSVYLNNGINATTAIDGGAKVYYLQIVKLTITPTIP